MELIRTGLMLGNLIGTVLEDLPEDAFGCEDCAEVLLEMVAGSVWPAADAAGFVAVRQATALIGAAADRSMADLEAALEIARARESG